MALCYVKRTFKEQLIKKELQRNIKWWMSLDKFELQILPYRFRGIGLFSLTHYSLCVERSTRVAQNLVGSIK